MSILGSESEMYVKKRPRVCFWASSLIKSHTWLRKPHLGWHIMRGCLWEAEMGWLVFCQVFILGCECFSSQSQCSAYLAPKAHIVCHFTCDCLKVMSKWPKKGTGRYFGDCYEGHYRQDPPFKGFEWPVLSAFGRREMVKRSAWLFYFGPVFYFDGNVLPIYWAAAVFQTCGRHLVCMNTFNPHRSSVKEEGPFYFTKMKIETQRDEVICLQDLTSK